jgi:hypothetical protein
VARDGLLLEEKLHGMVPVPALNAQEVTGVARVKPDHDGVNHPIRLDALGDILDGSRVEAAHDLIGGEECDFIAVDELDFHRVLLGPGESTLQTEM